MQSPQFNVPLVLAPNLKAAAAQTPKQMIAARNAVSRVPSRSARSKDATPSRNTPRRSTQADSGGLDKLRTLEVGKDGNLTTPQSGSPSYSRQPVASNLPPAQQPFADPAAKLQQDRLELNRQQLDFQKQRYNDQQAAAAARLKAQQEQADAQRAAGPASRGGGSAPQSQEEKLRKQNEDLKKKLKEAGAKGGGGGGRGGGGGISPEQKARNKAREARQTKLENEKMNRRDENKWAQSKGYGSMHEYNRAQETEAFFNKGREKNANSGRSNTKGNNNSPGGDPSYGSGTGGSNDTTGDAAAAAGMYDHLSNLIGDNEGSGGEKEKKRDWKKNPPVSDADVDNYNAEQGGGGGPKMVRAYGNKHSKVWVKARGDFR